ncbi:2Fe-2S iron-sulfur cluster-binding protein [Clostridium cochlearium]|jgi:succinate dehydrogenase / fumarate reductase iron-sulfur subunit|uniref:2Fe-2S iron-sulfur cluster-binding protein n=1 Tax=Clostridium cochlearium TaxID=1494 RepID=UPI000BBBC7E8|nr:2Fe-2S iron-sulfur cluster-binding protein [Clostridium cochlearium]
MEVKIFRCSDGNIENGYFDTFYVDQKDRNITVMDLLDYISLHEDSSIAYYKHSACYHGICGRCTLLVNGKPKLACTESISNYDNIQLEPLKNRKLIRDLVTE